MQQQQQYVGIDLHRRRSVIVRMTENGEVLSTVQIENDPMALSLALAEAGPDPEVALESTYGWYWAADLLQAEGARVHLVHPLGLHWDTRRVKNDVRDATALANRLRQNDLPESWIAPPAVREMREIVRYRAKLTALRTSAKAQIHAVMAKHGFLPELDDMFGPGGQRLFDKMGFEGVYALRVESLRDLLEIYNRELTMVERQMRHMFNDHAGYQAIQAITGVGPGHGGHLLRRDRRRQPLPHRPASVLVGGPDALAAASPTTNPTAATSPSKAQGWCAGRPPRPWPATTAAPPSAPPTNASRIGAAR